MIVSPPCQGSGLLSAINPSPGNGTGVPERGGIGYVFPVEGEPCPAAKHTVSRTVIFIEASRGPRNAQRGAGLCSCTRHLRSHVLVWNHCTAPFFEQCPSGIAGPACPGSLSRDCGLNTVFSGGSRSVLRKTASQADSPPGTGDTCHKPPSHLRRGN
jgi:hypothetical protein